MTMQRLQILLAGLVFTAGCDAFAETMGQAAPSQKSAPKPSASPTPPTGIPPHGPAFERRTTEMRVAIIAGDPATARAKADRLKQQLEGSPMVEHSELDELRAVTHQATQARSLDQLAMSLATIGQTCGACHQHQGVASGETPLDPPPAMQMQLHQWATDRLWEGLVQASPTRWQQGCDALRDDPLTGEVNDRVPREHVAQLKQVQALAHAAGQARDSNQQAKAYADLLTTCGNCHGS